jgi:primosomal replication protein N
VWIYFNVKDEKSGQMTRWGFEMGPPHLLQGSGWTNKSLKVGDEIEVGGFLAKNGSNRMSVNNRVGVKFAATGQPVGRSGAQLNNATQ